ncbi:MAG: MotA/TolQ/ExbB proton channel family protein [Gammaproteobacteria bacterium]|nr:MotA/TolQ/ExbB proton channel family protein [Gammaproteobacteria bacterium]
MLTLEDWLAFFERGGYVVVLILAVSCIMWSLIVERYWFITYSSRAHDRRMVEAWLKATEHSREWLRKAMLIEQHSLLQQFMPTIKVLTAILPLMGLFGTVTGMIKTFDAITLFGTGNIRGMAAGISEAMLTTMAGLVTALSGMYFISELQERVIAAEHRLASQLTNGDSDNEEAFDG